MYGVQWLKLAKDIFYNRKIRLILSMNEGDTYFRIWIQLLTLAVECGDGGRLIIGKNPITIKEFSKIMGKSSKKISKILEKFLELEMLIKDGEVFVIKNWNKYQSLERQEDYLSKNSERQRKYREKLKNEGEKSNVTVTLRNATEEKREEEITKEIRKEENRREEEENGFREYKL